MSHFTSVKTKIRDYTCLLQALEDLGYAYSEAEEGEQVRVRGYQGQEEKADVAIHASRSYDIGVQFNAEDGTYEFVADWWGVETTRGVTEEEFIQKLTQRYSYQKVMKEIHNRGFSVEQEEQQEDETIQVRVRSWA